MQAAGVADRRDAAVVLGEQRALERLHALGLAVLLVVHAEQVQQAVDDQQGHLVLGAHAVVRGVAQCHRRADHHVAEQHQRVVAGVGPRAGPTEVR